MGDSRSLAGKRAAAPASVPRGEAGSRCWCCWRGQPMVSVGMQPVQGLLPQILFMGGTGNGASEVQWKANHSLLSEFRLLTNKIFV